MSRSLALTIRAILTPHLLTWLSPRYLARIRTPLPRSLPGTITNGVIPAAQQTSRQCWQRAYRSKKVHRYTGTQVETLNLCTCFLVYLFTCVCVLIYLPRSQYE